MALNLEIKVRCTASFHDHVIEQLSGSGSSKPETLVQRDTYFLVTNGRLKLREITAASVSSAELIQYSRPDQTGMRLSSYRRIPVQIDAAQELRMSLSESIGVLTSVEKVRNLIVWKHTRIHLDDVANLGTFVELETVLEEGDAAEAAGRLEYEDVVTMLGLAALESVPGSYSDLMLVRGTD